MYTYVCLVFVLPQFLCEITPYKEYLSLGEYEFGIEEVKKLFDIEALPGHPIISPALLALGDWMAYAVSQNDKMTHGDWAW